MDPNWIVLGALIFITAFWLTLWWRRRIEVNGLDPKHSPLSPPVTNQVSPDLDMELRALMMCGEKIQAIKRLRTCSGLGLKESKDYVEALARRDAEAFSREP